MNYKYYKFPNKESVPAIRHWPENVSIYSIGLLLKKPAVQIGRTVVQQPVYEDGWFVNVAYQGEADLSFVEQYRIDVNNPKYVWIGQ